MTRTQFSPMSLNDYLKLKGKHAPSHTFNYGPSASQYIHLYLPLEYTPHTTGIMLLHGGCWTEQYQGIDQLAPLAEALQALGYIVWNVEYRRVDEKGGGYPGTYLDINMALEMIEIQSIAHQLDYHQLIIIGHSAGGHLAQWVSSRPLLPSNHLLHYSLNHLQLSGVIGLGSINDLKMACKACPNLSISQYRQLVGQSETGELLYQETSPIEMLPLQTHTILIHGALDDIAPLEFAENFFKHAQPSEKRLKIISVPNSGHYDEVNPHSNVFPILLEQINKLIALSTISMV